MTHPEFRQRYRVAGSLQPTQCTSTAELELIQDFGRLATRIYGCPACGNRISFNAAAELVLNDYTPARSIRPVPSEPVANPVDPP